MAAFVALKERLRCVEEEDAAPWRLDRPIPLHARDLAVGHNPAIASALPGIVSLLWAAGDRRILMLGCLRPSVPPLRRMKTPALGAD
jgi:hypothetical protein